MKLNKWQIKTVRLALYEAIESYDALIDAHHGHMGLTKFKDLDEDTQKMIRAWRYRIKKFRELYDKLGA